MNGRQYWKESIGAEPTNYGRIQSRGGQARQLDWRQSGSQATEHFGIEPVELDQALPRGQTCRGACRLKLHWLRAFVVSVGGKGRALPLGADRGDERE